MIIDPIPLGDIFSGNASLASLSGKKLKEIAPVPENMKYRYHGHGYAKLDMKPEDIAVARKRYLVLQGDSEQYPQETHDKKSDQ